ncbi:MAG: glutamine--fructose-6-phosphate transaminase (isomerizing) [Anaerolineae bacterium]
MCGIVGYVGPRQAAPLILDGLARLEYRGYDSAGIAVLHRDQIHIRRDVGKLTNLRSRVDAHALDGCIGIGHTRWATHGAPSERNAHPHVSMSGDFVVVHNGIVENYLELREELQAHGLRFQSDTDSEVIVQLIELFYRHGTHDLIDIMRCVLPRLRGAHAIVVLSRHQPDRLIATRVGNAGGVAIGLCEGEMFVASDLPAVLDHTHRIIFLEDQQIAIVRAESCAVFNGDGSLASPQIHEIPYDPISAGRGEYAHYMLKEIYEQPRSVTDTLRGRINFATGEIYLPELPLTAQEAQALNQIVTVACGTSYYSGLVGKFFIEQIARVRVEVDYASEYRYRHPILDEQTAVLAITQSGETVDTLAAIDEARRSGARVWSIVNALGSQAMRIADGHIAMHAGPEIGVASTKAFTTSIVDQYLLALYLAQQRGTLRPEEAQQHAEALAMLPDLIGHALQTDTQTRAIAADLRAFTSSLYLGRGINYPIALEGALKLKEISYIHAEGYPAGEMKHGPIALIDEQMPVVCIAPQDALYEKMLSQVEQARARGGRVVAVVTQGDRIMPTKADYVIELPACPPLLSPLVNVIPLQLLAYHIAVLRGADVDQPRNLAKSVTVE